MRLGETPVHIPNTMVKTQAADDTILETVWESRWVPDFKKRKFTNDLRSKNFWFQLVGKTAKTLLHLENCILNDTI